MKSVLEVIYYEKIENNDVLKDNKEYDKLAKESSDLYEELKKGLTAAQKEILSKIWLADAGMESEASLEYFKEGFKTCMRILDECFAAASR